MSQSDEQQMGISDARANLTDVIAEVRILDRPLVLTRREKPQAVLVSVDWFKAAKKAHREAAESQQLLVHVSALFRDKEFAARIHGKDPELFRAVTGMDLI